MASITLTLSGNSSQLRADYFPPIDLSEGDFVCGLVDLQTFNSIPNINESNNKFYFGKEGDVSNLFAIPMGTYEIDDLALYLKDRLAEYGVKFHLSANKNTLTSQIHSDVSIDFNHSNTIGSLLGFGRRYLRADMWNYSDSPVSILKVNMIRVECDITRGSYFNCAPAHTIHEFSPRVPPGYKISEVPSNVIYYPIIVKSISAINIALIDQDNDLINFRGETITIRLHIKRIR